MKRNFPAVRFPRQRGMALVSVLAVLFLLTLLVVAFMARTTSARASASNFHATANTRQLTDTAVNLVQAQINEATTLGITATGGATYTWGSQPGAIRVFDNTGALNSIYRLYSATARVVTGTSAVTQLANDLPTATTWSSYGAQWCDLNSFTLDTQGRYHFPICDPRDPGADPTANPTTVATLWQPTSGALALHGFSVYPPSTVGNVTNPAPMPVRWLYILKDGSIVSPDAPATANVLTFNNAVDSMNHQNIPSVANPIVGRIAYWTDDESSKININTAAGDDVLRTGNTSVNAASSLNIDGTHWWASQSIFWATPVFCANDEDCLAVFMPSTGEIERYSGHPGTVGLNNTLSTLLGLSSPLPYNDFLGVSSSSNGVGTSTSAGLTPRYSGGGSQSATVTAPLGGGQANGVPLMAQRLYTSVAEMMFNVSRSDSAFVNDANQASTAANEARASAAAERSNFFLTAHSSASELNLWGEPRVSIWPWTTTYQTPTDRLLAFDSTIARTQAGAAERFYFQRTDPTSTTTDCNIDGGVDGNIHLFNYLDTLTSSTIPGYGSNFTTDKYPNTTTPPAMRQIIAEIFDYIRTINMIDPVLVAATPYQSAAETYGQNWGLTTASVVPIENTATGAVNVGNTYSYRAASGGVQVVPSSNYQGNSATGLMGWGTQGVGAFPIPVEVTIDFAALGLGSQQAVGLYPATAETVIPNSQYAYPNLNHDSANAAVASDSIVDETNSGGQVVTPKTGNPYTGTTAMQAFVFVSFVNPAMLTSSMQPIFCYSMTGLNGLSVQGFVSNATGTVASGGNGYTTNGLTAKIPLFFPGTTANTVGNAFGSLTDEEFLVNDNSDGAGYINGYIGDWVFGYIPFTGETGMNNYGSNPALLGPNPYTSTPKWTISASVTLAGGTAASGNCRVFPFYSQIFALPGQSGWTTAHGNPNAGITSSSGALGTGATPTFVFNGSNTISGKLATITLTMYDAHKDNQALSGTDKVAQYSFTFPSSTVNANGYPTLPMPKDSSSDSQVIGTQMNTSDVWNNTTDRWHYPFDGTDQGNSFFKRHIAANDTVQSITLSPTWSDVRDLCMYTVGASSGTFAAHPLYGGGPFTNVQVQQAHDLFVQTDEAFTGNMSPTNWGRLVTQTVGAATSYAPSTVANTNNRLSGLNYPIVPPLLDGPNGTTGSAGQGAYTSHGAGLATTGAPGDWDNGVAFQPDGPWVGTADEGALQTNIQTNTSQSIGYFSTGNTGQKISVTSTFSPNRQVPSPAVFGSLPTGVNSTSPHPWQTLLFRPGSGAGGFGKYHWGERNEPTSGDPADHLLLDLFWMPQAEPYPISQPFETEGKINLNYEIQPFTYIVRNTALRALFAGEEIAVMPASLASTYKGTNYHTCTSASIISATGGYDPNGNTRLPINPDQTLGLNPTQSIDPHLPTTGTTPATNTGQTGVNAWYDSVLKTTRFFKSGSEICEMFLVPQGYDWSEFSGVTFNAHSWYSMTGDFALVGDNTRERPYSDLYSRVTTKSNTFTVYYTVQSLKNAEPQVNNPGSTTPGQQMWDETKGNVVGEFRGSTIIERYLDPNENMPDFLGSPGAQSLEPYYKWRVIESRQFAP
jgi:Tfp pilus assembly protein PilX